MKIKVFETVYNDDALQEFLNRKNITVREIHTAAAGAGNSSSYGFRHYVTVVYTDV